MRRTNYEAYKQLSGIRDDYITEAELPMAYVKRSMRRRRLKNRLSRVVQSNWFVAAVCTIVSLSTVSWIAYMGQRVPTEVPPPYGSMQESTATQYGDQDPMILYANPYEGMSREELYELYARQEAAISRAVTDHANRQYQTPYYVFVSDTEKEARVLNKLTGKYESICKIEGCEHTNPEDCPATYTKGLVPGSLRVANDCIYAVLESGQGEQALFIFDLDLTHPRMCGAYTAPSPLVMAYRNLLVANGTIYDVCMSITPKDGRFHFDSALFIVENGDIQEFASMISHIRDGALLYFSTHEGIMQANLQTGEIFPLLSAAELGYEVYHLPERDSSSGYPLLTALKNGRLYIETVTVTGESRYCTLTLDTMTLDPYIPAWEETAPESFLVYDGTAYMVKQGVVYATPLDGADTKMVARLPDGQACILVSCDGRILYAETETHILMIELETGKIYIP